MFFMASLNLPNLSKLINDPIAHDPTWLAMPAKLPLDIPKFEGKLGEDPSNHVMNYHLWCSSNSIMEDSIRLHLFQGTLTGPVAKWYINEASVSHASFESLSKSFLTYFRLLVPHELGMEILLTFCDNTSTHIANHIHEWCRRRNLCKIEISPEFLLDWFLKSLLPPIAKDVVYTSPANEAEAIHKAQHFDLI